MHCKSVKNYPRLQSHDTRHKVTRPQYRRGTVGPLSSATRRLITMQLLAANSQFSVLIGQKMQLTGWHSGNEMRNVICVDTQASIEWPYCPFPKLWTTLYLTNGNTMCAHNDKPTYIASRLTCCDGYWNIWQNKLGELVIGYICVICQNIQRMFYTDRKCI